MYGKPKVRSGGAGGALRARPTNRPADPVADDPRARAGVVAGEVLDARNGSPLSGAEIRIGDRLGTTTANDGSFLLRGVPAGEHDLVVQYLGDKPFTARFPTGVALARAAYFHVLR